MATGWGTINEAARYYWREKSRALLAALSTLAPEVPDGR